MLPTRYDRARAALQRMTALNEEQQAIYRTALYRALGLTSTEKMRLEQIACDIALAQDEFNRSWNLASLCRKERS